MEASSLLNEGLTLMLFGMGFVFIFLTLLVFVTSLMSRIITLYEKNVGVLPKGGVPSPTPVIPHHSPVNTLPADAKKPDENTLAILSAAIREYRARHK
jgi:oxaloacetate decarboxylase (Na+ extruding) subunit gamma